MLIIAQNNQFSNMYLKNCSKKIKNPINIGFFDIIFYILQLFKHKFVTKFIAIKYNDYA